MDFDLDLVERFWPKVRFNARCWEWSASKSDVGYGQIAFHGRLYLAHRVAYELCVGPIPAGLVLDHLCRNPGCVRPSHLEAVSHGENIRRGYAVRPPLTHCPQGHAYDSKNTRIAKNGRRFCRTCDNLRHAARRARNRATSISEWEEGQASVEFVPVDNG